MGLNGAKKAKRPTRGGLIAALDVGSTKVCCFIARVEDAGAVFGELFPAFLGPAVLLLLVEILLATTVFRRFP